MPTSTITSATFIENTLTRTINSNTFIATTASELLTRCSQGFLSTLVACVEDQDLEPTEDGGTVYVTGNLNLLVNPPVVVHRVDPSTGAEVLLYEGTDYTVNHAAGEITLVVATTDIIRVHYSYRPLSDETMEELFLMSVSEVGVLVRRTIDPESILVEYETAICLQFTINVLKTLLIETRSFFAVSVAGKSISLDNIPKTFELIIGTYQEELMLLVRQLRQWNTSNRLE